MQLQQQLFSLAWKLKTMKRYDAALVGANMTTKVEGDATYKWLYQATGLNDADKF
jgi:hypothetical protein